MLTSSVTSLGCAIALQRLGFAVEESNDVCVVLIRAGRRVFIPRHRVLSPPQVLAILRIAHVDAEAFIEKLPPGISGTFPRTPANAEALDPLPSTRPEPVRRGSR